MRYPWAVPGRKVVCYAGIGSRDTPVDVLAKMEGIARDLYVMGYTLRSGGAAGADSAFERGAGDMKEIFRASDATPASLELASKYHPAWHRCSEYAKKLHARNGFQVLGRDLFSPSQFVVCWTKDGGPTGGTGQAIRLATAYQIPVFNLFHADAMERMWGMVLTPAPNAPMLPETTE